MTYDEEFREALTFSRSENFLVPAFSPATGRFITPSTADLLLKMFSDFTNGGRNQELLCGQCVGVAMRLSKRLRDEPGWTAFVTIGKLSRTNKVLFNCSQEDVRRWKKDGMDDLLNMPLHAWITLPSMELIDFTYRASVNVLDELNEPAAFDAGHWTHFLPSRYNPIAVGDNIAELLGIPI
jgi:hypothetical protein